MQVHDAPEKIKADLTKLLERMLEDSLLVVECVVDWRRDLWWPRPFVWRTIDYFLKLDEDLTFMASDAGAVPPSDGVCSIPVSQENTFLNAGMELLAMLDIHTSHLAFSGLVKNEKFRGLVSKDIAVRLSEAASVVMASREEQFSEAESALMGRYVPVLRWGALPTAV